jgi:hypothetical protein
MPPTLRNEAAEMLADIMHSLVSSKFENMADQVRGSSPRRDAQLAIPAFSLRCGAEKARRDTRRISPSAAAELQTVGNRTWALFDLR